MTSPRSAPSRKPLGSEPGLSGEAKGSASADHGRTAAMGSGRSRSAAASTPQRSVSLGEVGRLVGPTGVDTGAGRVPYIGWPGSPHAANAGSRGAGYGGENAGETPGPPASWSAPDCLGADGDT